MRLLTCSRSRAEALTSHASPVPPSSLTVRGRTNPFCCQRSVLHRWSGGRAGADVSGHFLSPDVTKGWRVRLTAENAGCWLLGFRRARIPPADRTSGAPAARPGSPCERQGLRVLTVPEVEPAAEMAVGRPPRGGGAAGLLCPTQQGR